MEEIETTENRVEGKIVEIEITEITIEELDLQGKICLRCLMEKLQNHFFYKHQDCDKYKITILLPFIQARS